MSFIYLYVIKNTQLVKLITGDTAMQGTNYSKNTALQGTNNRINTALQGSIATMKTNGKV